MHKPSTLPAYLACALGSLILFAWLAAQITTGGLEGFDSSVRDYIHQHASPSLTAAMRGVTLLGSVLFVLVVFAIFFAVFWRMDRRNLARALAWVMAGSVVLDNTLKYAFHRARPEPFFGAVPRSYSFPSGHALFSLCLYGGLAGILAARIRRRAIRALVWISAIALIVLVGLSRIYLGVHYPTDVLGGYLAAAFWLCALAALREWLVACAKL